MLLDYHEIDPSGTASAQEQWLLEQEEIKIFGMTKNEFDSMDPEIYARFLSGEKIFDL